MSDYDAAFAAAFGGDKKEDPYDAVMRQSLPKQKEDATANPVAPPTQIVQVAPATNTQEDSLFNKLGNALFGRNGALRSVNQPFVAYGADSKPEDATKQALPAAGLVYGATANIGDSLLNMAVNGGEKLKNAVTSPSTTDLVLGGRQASSIKKWNDSRSATLKGMTQFSSPEDQAAFDSGKLVGNIIATAPVGGALAEGLSAIPGATKYAPSIIDAVKTSGMSANGAKGLAGVGARGIGGGVNGYVQTALTDPDNKNLGAAFGAGLPIVTQAVGAVGRYVGKMFMPSVANAELAKDALERGAPLGIADISDSRFTKAIRSVLNDAPLTGGIGANQKAAQQSWFNQSVGKTFGAAESKLTPEVMDAAKKKMGAEFDRIWGSNVLNVDDGLMASMSEARKNAAMLPKADRTRVISILDDFENQVQQSVDGKIVIPGDVANRYQSKIREVADNATGFLKNDMTKLRKDIIAAFNRSVSPEDATALALNQSKYKAFKTVEPLLSKAEVGVAGREAGDVPAALLPNNVYQNYGTTGGNTELGKLSKIGSKFLVDRTPQTGGSTRAAIQNGAIGTALTLGTYSNPYTLAAIPIGISANKALGSPTLARSILLKSSQPAAEGLLNQSLYKALPVTAAGLLNGQ